MYLKRKVIFKNYRATNLVHISPSPCWGSRGQRATSCPCMRAIVVHFSEKRKKKKKIHLDNIFAQEEKSKKKENEKEKKMVDEPKYLNNLALLNLKSVQNSKLKWIQQHLPSLQHFPCGYRSSKVQNLHHRVLYKHGWKPWKGENPIVRKESFFWKALMIQI